MVYYQNHKAKDTVNYIKELFSSNSEKEPMFNGYRP